MGTSLEEKLTEFSATVIAEAQKKRAEIEAENNRIKTKKTEYAQDKYLAKAYNIIQNGIVEIKKADNEMVLNAENNSRRELLLKREKIIDDVFKKAQTRLKEFSDTDEYITWLEKKLLSALETAGEGHIVVYVRKADIEQIKAIISKISVNNSDISVDIDEKMDDLAGIKLKNTTKNIFIDYSFAELLSSVKNDFLQKSGLRID